MQLKKIDSICLQSVQRCVCRANNRIRRKILRNFALPAPACFPVMDKIVADLGRDHDFIPLVRECLCDQLFAQSISVRVGRIEQRDPEIERLAHERDRFALSEISPPTGGDCPQSEADFADCQVSVFVSAKAHTATISSSVARVQAIATLALFRLVYKTNDESALLFGRLPYFVP